jgi:hypothetical protein
MMAPVLPAACDEPFFITYVSLNDSQADANVIFSAKARHAGPSLEFRKSARNSWFPDDP